MSLYREQIVKRLSRDSNWSKIRKKFLEENNVCSNCGSNVGLEVHHVKPVHTHPHLELEFSNLITLCSKDSCHLEKGHLGDWKSWNSRVRMDCREWNKKRVNRP